MMAKRKSPSLHIDTVGLKKVGKGALIAGGAAVLTYLAEAIPGLNFGEYTPVIVGVAGIVINFLRKFLMSYK
jgi:hypothetical protein